MELEGAVLHMCGSVDEDEHVWVELDTSGVGGALMRELHLLKGALETVATKCRTP